MVIAIEGMDGVGKTTIAKHLSEKYGFAFIDKPIKYLFGKENEKITPELDRLLNLIYDYDDNIIKTWFFGLGNIMAVRNFAGHDIIIDRHFVSNYYWNSDDSCQAIYRALFDIIVKPDLTIILYADTETRMQRIKHRDETDPDLFDDEKYDDGFSRMIEFVENNSHFYRVIDTSGLTINEVKHSADSIMDDFLNKNISLVMTKTR